jgi:hypothetical protein
MLIFAGTLTQIINEFLKQEGINYGCQKHQKLRYSCLQMLKLLGFVKISSLILIKNFLKFGTILANLYSWRSLYLFKLNLK